MLWVDVLYIHYVFTNNFEFVVSVFISLHVIINHKLPHSEKNTEKRFEWLTARLNALRSGQGETTT